MAFNFNPNKKLIDDLNNEIKSLNSKVKTISRSFEEQENMLHKFQTDFQELSKKQDLFLEKNEKLLEQITSQEKILSKAIAEINLFKPRLEKQLLDKFSLGLEQELANITNKIKAEMNGYNSSKELLTKYIKQTKDAMNELDKFQRLANLIKNKDLELNEYNKILEKNDQEKLRLMKKIDHLENLLVKLKKTQRRT
jgi:chromosome segregation ATPase